MPSPTYDAIKKYRKGKRFIIINNETADKLNTIKTKYKIKSYHDAILLLFSLTENKI